MSNGAVVAALAVCLYLLAGAQVGGLLADRGDQELMHLSARISPWDWRLHGPGDLVAQRAFGMVQARSDRGQALRLSSRNGERYEIGLPLQRDADLDRAPWLELQASGTRPRRLYLIRAAAPGAARCSALLPPAQWPHWNLKRLHWTASAPGACAGMRAAMVRLAVVPFAGTTLRLAHIALAPERNLRLAHEVIPLPSAPAQARTRLRDLARHGADDVWARVMLPATHSPQHLLALRDLVHQLCPGATVVLGYRSGWMRRTSPAHSASIVLIYALLIAASLLHRRQWTPRHPRAWRLAQLVLTLAGPLWLIAGMHLDLHTPWPYPLAAGLGIAYGGWVAYRLRRAGAPAASWWGTARSAFPALAAIPAALALALWQGHAWHAVPWRHVALYPLWALLQQWLMLAVVLRLIESVWPRHRNRAIIGTALVFALLHTPNARLMLLCFGAELWWAHSFLRHRAIIPVAVAHAACALILESALSGGWLRSLEVSARYLLTP